MNFEQTVDCLVTLPKRHAVLIIGRHGIGKSDAVRLSGKIMGDHPVIDMRLSQCDIGDIKGFPTSINGVMHWAPPSWFPLSEAEIQKMNQIDCNTVGNLKYQPSGTLFLDEIDRATREVQQGAFELALDHRLNQKLMPEDWRVVAAVNGDGDVYHVNDMDMAFIDRFFVINFDPSREEWFNYARKDSRIHSAVIDFLVKFQDKFMDPSKELMEASPGEKLFSRRSWERFSQCLLSHEALYAAGKVAYNLLDKSTKGLSMLTHIGTGYLGAGAGIAFRNFIETEYASFDADTIINKFTKDVEKKLKKLVDNNKIIELGHYNELISNYIEDKKITELNATQSKNLLSYIQIVPNECALDFWKTWMLTKNKAVAMKWYQGTERAGVVARIVSCSSNPQTGKGA